MVTWHHVNVPEQQTPNTYYFEFISYLRQLKKYLKQNYTNFILEIWPNIFTVNHNNNIILPFQQMVKISSKHAVFKKSLLRFFLRIKHFQEHNT